MKIIFTRTGILPENIPPKGGNDETKTKMDALIEEDKPVILQLPKNATTVANNTVILEKPQEVVTNVSNNSLVINQPKPQDSGALYRLFLVLLGICALTVVYVSYRFYRYSDYIRVMLKFVVHTRYVSG